MRESLYRERVKVEEFFEGHKPSTGLLKQVKHFNWRKGMRKGLSVNRIVVTIIFLDCLHLSVIHMPLILHMPYTDEKVFWWEVSE